MDLAGAMTHHRTQLRDCSPQADVENAKNGTANRHAAETVQSVSTEYLTPAPWGNDSFGGTLLSGFESLKVPHVCKKAYAVLNRRNGAPTASNQAFAGPRECD